MADQAIAKCQQTESLLRRSYDSLTLAIGY